MEFKKIIDSFGLRDELNPKFWDSSDKLKPKIRKNLMQVVDDYFSGSELSDIDIEDVLFMGSLANYNWSEFSDIDLHVVIDFKDIGVDEDLVAELLRAKSSLWNESHDIKIYGYDVEIFVQDINHEYTSGGVYSIMDNEWVEKPDKTKSPINDEGIKKKVDRFSEKIDCLYDHLHSGDVEFDKIFKSSDKLKEKLRKFRQSGLTKGGEFSEENLAFKALRRSGLLDRLDDIKTLAYDKMLTIESMLK